MKYYLILSLLSVLVLSSCTSVYFDRPQPKGGERLNSVPSELQGVWVDKFDTIKMTAQQLLRINTESDSLDNIIDVSEYAYVLSDTVRLYKAGEYYVANLFDATKGWEILVADKKDNGDIVWYYPLEHPHFGKKLGFIGGLRLDKVERSKTIETADSSYTENFTNKSIEKIEGENIDAVYYKGQFKIKHIPMIIKSENVYWKWNANGTMGDEDEEINE